MKAIDDLIKDADSILTTLDKDYEAMQTHKSDVRQDQVDKYDNLRNNMCSVLKQYSDTINKFRSKIDRSYDAEGTEVTIYEYPNGNKILTMKPMLYWTGTGVPTFYIKIYVKHKDERGYYDSEGLAVSETEIELLTAGLNPDNKGFSDVASIFLNHCPTYEQLDVAFQTALTDFIKYCVTSIQKRNECMADKIKSITQ
jgi:hypothetical protein